MERGKKRVGTGSKTGFKRQKNGISPNSTIWNGVERPFLAVPHLSCRFLAVPLRFSPIFHDFGQKREKNGCPKMEERERKERVPFPFLSRSRFFPFLAWHISNSNTSHRALLIKGKCTSTKPPPPSAELENVMVEMHVEDSNELNDFQACIERIQVMDTASHERVGF